MNPFWIEEKQQGLDYFFIHGKKYPAKWRDLNYFFSVAVLSLALNSSEIAERSILSFPASVSIIQVLSLSLSSMIFPWLPLFVMTRSPFFMSRIKFFSQTTRPWISQAASRTTSSQFSSFWPNFRTTLQQTSSGTCQYVQQCQQT